MDEKAYKDKYFDLKFENLDKKLDELLTLYGSKASAVVVDDLKQRIAKVEQTHNVCALHGMIPDVEKLKQDRDTLMDATSDVRFYQKRLSQFKLMMIGLVILIALNGIAFIPGIYFAKKYFAELKKVETEIKTEKK